MMDTSAPRRAEQRQDALGRYLVEVKRVPLLSRDDEVRLARLIEAGRNAERQLDGAHGVQPNPHHDELLTAVSRGETARQAFIEANLRLVVSVARRFAGRGAPMLDLIQEGNLGLMHAVDKFDWRKGFKFSTYATWWIKQALTRAVPRTNRTIRIPAHVAERAADLQRTADDLQRSLGRSLHGDELALSIGRSPAAVALELTTLQPIRSLDEPGPGDASQGLLDRLPDPTSPDQQELAERADRAHRAAGLLEALDARERTIMWLRFGFIAKPHTLEETGQLLKLSKERVRQIERRAVCKLRHPAHGPECWTVPDQCSLPEVPADNLMQ